MRQIKRGVGISSGFTLALLAVSSPHAAMRGQEPQLPFGWSATMGVPSEYSVRADVSRRLGGSGFVTGTISSSVEEPRQSAMMQQSILADLYRGKRLRLTGYLKANIAQGQAGLFMRIDGRELPQVSDFMVGRLVQATKEWEHYSIVLDVPNDAVGITFGFHLTGKGQAWLDDVSLETVGQEVAITVDFASQMPFALTPRPGSRPLWEKYLHARFQPVNLDFEQLKSIAAQ